MQRHPLRIHWIALAVLSVLVLAGTFAARVSSSPAIATLALTKDGTARVSVFRLLPDAARVSIEFERARGQERPELGSFVSKSGSGWIEFSSPGAPVIVQVRGPESAAEYEALPATAYGAQHISRDLVVRGGDGNPHRFVWPPDNAARPVLPAGWSTLEFSVVEVGAPLADQVVQVVVEPPLSFKSSIPGYGFLWWFFFWPILAFPLACYGAYLAWRTWGLRRRRT